MTDTTSPTGQQHLLEHAGPLGVSRAVITELAASIRSFTVDGVDLTQPYGLETTAPFGCGIVLVPWPNRVEDGAWILDGAPMQLDITEVDRNNAIHGLLANTGYQLVERTASSVTLAATVFPQRGYHFHLDTRVTYTLVDDGLSVVHEIRNLSATAAPVAVGTHPFLTIGDVPAEQLVLTVHGATRFAVDARLNPQGEVPVDGDYDLRGGRLLAELQLDDAFGSLSPVDGVSASLRAPDGREVRLVQDDNHPYVQVFTTRNFPTPDGPALAVAIEPMTAPANALNSGQSLKWLESQQSWTVSWGIQYSR